MTLTTGTRLGPYEIVSRIGAGGMGEVYKARDTRLDRSVAIKVLPREFASDTQLRLRFEREAKSISQFNHPHICTLHDVGQADGIDYLVLEFVDGETLAERLTRGPLVVSEVLLFGEQIAQALDRAHRGGIVHRDLKPGNIMITKSGAKLLDFGLALNRGTSASPEPIAKTEQKPLTAEGTVIGTYQYMSPEQLSGEDADTRSDIFSLGAVLYEMVTGRRAFEGKTRTSIVAAILAGEPRAAAELQPTTPPALEHVIANCLAKDRNERWQSAADIATELHWIRTSKAVSDKPASARTPWPARAIRGAGMLALLIATAALTIVWMRRQTAPHPTFHSELSLTDGERLAPLSAGPIALSADGTKLAFVVGSAESSRLAVRDLRSGKTGTIAETEGASFPFWSPDGARLGFFASGKLKTIGANGTGMQVLCAAPNARGGTWTSGGRIVFAPEPAGSLFSVDENGGTPVGITRSAANATHRMPFALPDGDTVLFSIRNDVNRDGGDLYSLSLRSGQTRRIVENASRPAYAAGRLLFVRNENLFAQPFDVREQKITGAPVAIADGVDYDSGRILANFAVADAALTYVPAAHAPRQLIAIDRAGNLSPLATAPGDDRVTDMSRDGHLVAVLTDEWRDADIWLLDLQRGTRSRLTFLHGVSATAVFSPDGTHIAFTSYDGSRTRVFLQSLELSGPESLTEVPAWLQVDSWTRDGKFILCSFRNPRTGFDVVAIDVATRKIVPVITGPADEALPKVAPNQQWMAYESNESGTQQTYITRFPSAVGKWQVSTDGGVHPAWSSDGRELYYTFRNRLFRVHVQSEPQLQLSKPEALYMMPMDVVGIRGSGYTVAPDGRVITVRPDPAIPPPMIHLVTNWANDLPAQAR